MMSHTESSPTDCCRITKNTTEGTGLPPLWYRHDFEDYVAVCQEPNEDKPVIFVNADALLIGRAMQILQTSFNEALALLDKDEQMSVIEQLRLDKSLK